MDRPLFLSLGYEDILRLNVQAIVIKDAELLEPLSADGKRPIIGVGVQVVDAHMHCAKLAKWVSLQDMVGWPDHSQIEPMAQIL